jgi:hypothetical protein
LCKSPHDDDVRLEQSAMAQYEAPSEMEFLYNFAMMHQHFFSCFPMNHLPIVVSICETFPFL